MIISSSYDVGYYTSLEMKIINEPCKNSPNGKHDFELKQLNWDECKYCGRNRYWK